MSSPEIYRYFWIKVTDAKARVASEKAVLKLQQTLTARSTAAKANSAEAIEARVQKDMVRWYLASVSPKGTRIVVVAPPGGGLALEVLATAPHAIAKGTWQIAIAPMPPGYSKRQSTDWIDTPVGQVWAKGAAVCRLSHAVITPASTK